MTPWKSKDNWDNVTHVPDKITMSKIKNTNTSIYRQRPKDSATLHIRIYQRLTQQATQSSKFIEIFKFSEMKIMRYVFKHPTKSLQ